MPGRSDRGGRERPKNTRGALGRTLSYLKRYAGTVGLLILCALFSNLGNLLGPSFAGNAINALGSGEGQVDFRAVNQACLCMLLAYAGSSLMTFLVSTGMMRVSKSITQGMRQDLFEKLHRLPVGYFDKRLVGDILSRLSYDVDVVGTSLSTDVVHIVTSLVTVIGSFVMMCYLCVPLTLVTMVTIPLSILYTRQMRKITRPLYGRRSAAYGAMNGFVEEMVTGQRAVVSFAYQEGVSRQFDTYNRQAAKAYERADGLGVTMGPTMGLLNNIGLALIGLGGSLLYLNGKVSLGQISAFILYSRKFSGPVNEIANIINEIFSALAAAERIFALLDEEEEGAASPMALPLGEVRGEVDMEQVSFGYVPGREILHQITLHAPAGRTIALVGPTGAGKSTIINLLMRFYDPQEGSILLDGRDTRLLPRKELRGAFAMVLQETWVFSGSIFENIAYGKEGASWEEVVAAAKAARLHNAILALPRGYDTLIGEDAGNISKGQRQLLTLARAMLFDARCLILDEATSNVDTNTERAVQRAMRELMQGKTSFVIAHRLATVQNADQILVIDQGQVVEQGTHRELMEKGGLYAAMYRSQFR